MAQGGINGQRLVQNLTTMIGAPCLAWWQARLLGAISPDMDVPPFVAQQPDS